MLWVIGAFVLGIFVGMGMTLLVLGLCAAAKRGAESPLCKWEK